MGTKQTRDQNEQTDRRTMLATLGAALGALAVAGCDEEPGKLSSDDPVQKSVGTLLAAGTSIVWVDSIAGSGTNLQGSTGTSLGDVVVVGGYDNPGDGGGGIFYWDASSTSADDGGLVFGAAPLGRWIRLVTAPLNPRWFGAKGDGTTDDTNALRAMFQAGTSFDLGTGTYLVSLTEPTSLASFTGKASVEIRGANALIKDVSTYSGDPLTWIYKFVSCTNITVDVNYVGPTKTADSVSLESAGATVVGFYNGVATRGSVPQYGMLATASTRVPTRTRLLATAWTYKATSTPLTPAIPSRSTVRHRST